MRTWLSKAIGRGVALLVLAGAGATGCTAAGQLHDAGQAAPISRPSPLWPAALTTSSPAPAASGQAPPAPLAGITAAGDRIQDLDVHTVLAADKALTGDELAALAGCAGCEVRPAQYRDLTGDGRAELITAVLTANRTAYLHVYTLQGGKVLPVLGIQVLPSFTADTVEARPGNSTEVDLVVREQTGQETEMSSTYAWNGVRLAVKDRQIHADGPLADIPACATASPGTTPGPKWPGPSLPGGVRPSAQPSVVPPAEAGPTAAAVRPSAQPSGPLPAPVRS